MTKSIRAIPLLLVIVLIVSITSVVSAQSGPASCANDGAVTDAANNPGLVSDCAGLLASRDTLSGSATLNWSAGLAVEDWEGVTVGGSPRRVTRLILSRNELTGSIPGELGGLTNLEDLNLSGNQLTGEIPAELGGLTNLEDLNLYGNQLTGEIPGELGGLANLQTLWLSGNQLTGIPAELGSLTNLETLWLSRNELTGSIPGELGGLTNLEDLNLSGNQLTGEIPAELGGLTNLEDLNLYGNQLTGEIPGELGGLANLQTLWLSGNQLTGIPAELGSLTNLETLWLSRNELTGSIPGELGGLTNLEDLNLSGNQLTGEIPAELGGLTNLEDLNLYGNQLTGEIPGELGGLANLQTLWLSGNQLTGIPAELGSLTNLETLWLSRNELTGSIPGELGGLTNLEDLNLSGNQLTGEIPAELGGLTNLEDLNLSGNQLTGEIPGELGGLANLQTLWLSGNQLTGEIPGELGGLANLQTLWLSGNQLTGCIPQNLRRIETNDLSQLGLPFCDMPGAPTIATPIGPGDASLTVAWAVPINTGSSAITAYDLRYIETGAADKSDANWTVVEDVWAAGSGSLQYTLTGLTGLTGGTQYDVQVRAVNAAGPGAWSGTETGTPPPPPPPVFVDGPRTDRSIAENTAAGENVGAPVVATDSGILTYMLGGADATSFDIDRATGQLQTKAKLDYETKDSYEVMVTATDPDSASDMITVTVTVTNVEEPGMVTLWAGADALTMAPQVGDTITGAVMDPDGGETVESWQWSRTTTPTMMGSWVEIEGETNAAYMVMEGDNGYYLRATAMYDDGEGMGKMASMQTMMVTMNASPMFDSETAERSVAENTAANMAIGAPVTATDADDDTLTYTLGGDDEASFDIDPATGQLKTKATLDFETKASYSVTVTATDGDDASDTVTVTISVTGVDELTISGVPAVNYAENGTGPVATYAVAGPDSDMATWSLEGDDMGDFSISSGGVLTFNSPPDYENPMDMDGDNVYMVTVVANDGAYKDTHDVMVTVTTLLGRFDANNDGSIDQDEIGTAVIAYQFDRTINQADIEELIILYQFGGG